MHPPETVGTTPLQTSVVIPAFNAAAFLDDAMASIAAQTRPPLEVIVIDDGSTDGTSDIAERWRPRLGAVALGVERQDNRGLSVARNHGVLRARGDLVAFLDADDEFLPHHLAALVPAFERHDDLVLAFGDMECWPAEFAKTPRQLDRVRDELRRLSTPSGCAGVSLLSAEVCAVNLRRPSILPTSWIIRRTALPAIGLFLPRCPYAEDVEFFIRISRAGTIAWHEAPTARRRFHQRSLTADSFSRESEPAALRLYSQLQRRWDLTPAEFDALSAVMDQAVFEIGYDASDEGLAAYRRARRMMRWVLGRRLAPAPRLLARAMFHSLWPSRRRGGN